MKKLFAKLDSSPDSPSQYRNHLVKQPPLVQLGSCGFGRAMAGMESCWKKMVQVLDMWERGTRCTLQSWRTSVGHSFWSWRVHRFSPGCYKARQEFLTKEVPEIRWQKQLIISRTEWQMSLLYCCETEFGCLSAQPVLWQLVFNAGLPGGTSSLCLAGVCTALRRRWGRCSQWLLKLLILSDDNPSNT